MELNQVWKFKIENSKDAFKLKTNDSEWQSVLVPHDWSIESGYDQEKGDGATGYLLGGIGWYRNHFQVELVQNQKAFLIFDGVYNNAEFWLNGRKIGEHPYGYSPFYFDITDFIVQGDNVLAVRVDRSRYVDSRWYTGSGIYRPVKLLVTDKIYLPVWGLSIETPVVNAESAEILCRYELINEYPYPVEVETLFCIIDSEKNKVCEDPSTSILSSGETVNIEQQLSVKSPQLWDVETPKLYSAELILKVKGQIVGKRETSFGIRSFRFDKEHGFFLNERNLKIKGVCLHHDGGLAGAAVPPDIWRRRLLKLKAAGCNAVRMAHNPASSELLDLCDELGFLVQDEFFDEWDNPKDKRLNGRERHDDYLSRGYTEHFQSWAKQDLQNTIRCHRNHPSIFQWSIGNEIEWTYQRNVEATGFFGPDAAGNYFWETPPNSPAEIRKELEALPRDEYDIGETAKKLAAWTREIDSTRPVTANCILPSASFEAGYTDALDVVGFSYRRVMYDYAREHYPAKICMGTENVGQWHEWKAVEERDFIAGLFLWTGIDYIGEAAGKSWPVKNLSTGLLDQAGFRKPGYHMYKSLWNPEPHIALFTQTEEKSLFKSASESRSDCFTAEEKEPGAWKQRLWFWQEVNSHWNYDPGESVVAESYSNCPEAELFINGRSLGRQQLSAHEDRIYKWVLIFEAGELRVVGYPEESSPVSEILTTAGSAVQLRLESDFTRIDAGRCIHITAQLFDAEAKPCRHEEREIEFSIKGEYELIGVDNGAPDNVQPHKTNRIKTKNGRALLVIRAVSAGILQIDAESEALDGNTIRITVEG